MGGACVCNRKISESWLFWSRLNIRKMTFQEYTKIFEEKRQDWLKSANKINNYSIEISECEVLRDLLNSPDFSEKERTFFFGKLKRFISEQTDKLTFLTCLAFLTKLEPSKEKSTELVDDNDSKNKDKKFSLEEEAKKYIESLKTHTIKENFDIIFDRLLNMAIKKYDHNDVTKTFIELVSEFSVDLLQEEPKIKKELILQYSRETREKLFLKLIDLPKKKFYEYIFNEKNVKLITDDLARLHRDSAFASNNKKNLHSDNPHDGYTIKVDLSKKASFKKNKTESDKEIGRI